MQMEQSLSGQVLPFDSLPDEVLEIVLNKVGREDVRKLLRAQQVCRRWQSVSFSIPDITWPLSTTSSGAALVHFLTCRLRSTSSINSVLLNLRKGAYLRGPLETVVAALKPFSLKAFALVNPLWDCGIRGDVRLDASEWLFEQARAFEGLESLTLNFFGSSLEHTGIGKPLSPSFQSLRSLELNDLRINRPALEQLINQCPNLEEADYHMSPEWAHIYNARGEPFLHIKSRSLKRLCARENDKAYCNGWTS
jgi:hypothetical protein